MNFGICTAGLEKPFEQALLERALPRKPFVYLEIGLAHCETWAAVCQILARTSAHWRTIGIDPSQLALDSYKMRIEPHPWPATFLFGSREHAFTDPNAKHLLDQFHFVFIDGCHAPPCVKGDFLSVEPLVAPGGLVVFHDFQPGACDIQPHCNMAAGVLQAVTDLGLCDGTRAGWRRLPDWIGDRKDRGPDWGADCGVFEKV